MQIAFRADASIEIGSGHIMRCLTLARALTDRGANCIFICRDLPGNLIGLVEREGYGTITLHDVRHPRPGPFAHSAWLGTTTAVDAAETNSALGSRVFDWMIVDHYSIGAEWEHAVRKRYRRLFVIDDLADRAHTADTILDQNLHHSASDYKSQTKTGARILLGPKYALLRQEFREWRCFSLSRRIAPTMKRVLVNMGGVDRDNMTRVVLETMALSAATLDFEATVILGPSSPWEESLQTLAASLPFETRIMVDVTNIAELMAYSDLAIGAVGVTALERCALALPSIAIAIAENQKPALRALAQRGAVIAVASPSVRRDLSAVLLDATRIDCLRNLAFNAATIVDALGVDRVASILLDG